MVSLRDDMRADVALLARLLGLTATGAVLTAIVMQCAP